MDAVQATARRLEFKCRHGFCVAARLRLPCPLAGASAGSAVPDQKPRCESVTAQQWAVAIGECSAQEQKN